GGVQALPHLGADALPHPPGVLPGAADRPGDRAGGRLVVGEHLIDRSAAGRGHALAGAHHVEQRPAGLLLIDPRILEEKVVVDVEDPGGVLGPLDVAADPEECLGDAAQHDGCPDRRWSCCCCCCCCWAAIRPLGPASGATAGSGGAT